MTHTPGLPPIRRGASRPTLCPGRGALHSQRPARPPTLPSPRTPAEPTTASPQSPHRTPLPRFSQPTNPTPFPRVTSQRHQLTPNPRPITQPHRSSAPPVFSPAPHPRPTATVARSATKFPAVSSDPRPISTRILLHRKQRSTRSTVVASREADGLLGSTRRSFA